VDSGVVAPLFSPRRDRKTEFSWAACMNVCNHPSLRIVVISAIDRENAALMPDCLPLAVDCYC